MSNDTQTTSTAGSVAPPVTDWASDYDIFDPQYIADPYPIWAELRETCPVAHTDRWAVRGCRPGTRTCTQSPTTSRRSRPVTASP
jgi:cytochrome P450